MDYKVAEQLIYWIQERETVRLAKERGEPKPWSPDPIFRNTYFCNVFREFDRVTKFVRWMYSPYVNDRMFLFNIILARFINRPETLTKLGYITEEDWESGQIESILASMLAHDQKIWGNAYVITTHGIKMPKAVYLTSNVLESVYNNLGALNAATRGHSCAAAANALQGIEGIGSFLSGQIVADLKNTYGHPLQQAEDWFSFVTPGPGSLRGLSWIMNGTAKGVVNFKESFNLVRAYVDRHAGLGGWMKEIHNQDLQNCLCEFDKFMRVKTGTGRSKRKYPGAVL